MQHANWILVFGGTIQHAHFVDDGSLHERIQPLRLGENEDQHWWISIGSPLTDGIRGLLGDQFFQKLTCNFSALPRTRDSWRIRCWFMLVHVAFEAPETNHCGSDHCTAIVAALLSFARWEP